MGKASGNKIRVSFIIPTFRDFCNYACRTMDSIYYAKLPFKYEIIVCSKSKPDSDECLWVKEPERNSGSVLPVNLAYRIAKGQYISVLADDWDIDDTFPEAIQFLESSAFKGLKVKCTGLQPKNPIILDGILRFPVIEKKGAVKYLGNSLFDSRFRQHQCDVFLTTYLNEKLRVPTPICTSANVFMRSSESCKQDDVIDNAVLHYLTTNLENIDYL